jgi:hypothetical protein
MCNKGNKVACISDKTTAFVRQMTTREIDITAQFLIKELDCKGKDGNDRVQ